MPHVYGLGPEQVAFTQRAAALATAELRTHAPDVDAAGRFPTESMAAVAKAGLFGLCVSQEFGGAGQGPRVFAAVVEELGQACSSTAMIYVMHAARVQAIAVADAR